MKVGNLTGFGGNTWTVEMQAVIAKFKAYCPNITGIETYDAQGDATKFNDTLNAWAAQGFNVAYATSGVFGTQTLPAFRKAQQFGLKIGVSNAPLGDAVVPKSVTASVVQDFADMGTRFVKFLDAAKKKGTSKILVIGGTAGNTFDPLVVSEMQKAIRDTGAHVEFLQPSPVVGNWDIAASAQAAASVISKYPEIDGLVLTNAAVASGVIRAFQNAGRPVPTIAGTGITSGVLCDLHAARKKDPNINMISLDASGNVPALALAKAIAAYQGIRAPELGPDDAETYVKLATYVDTLNHQIPKCDPALPADADPTMALTAQEIAAAVK
nr:substrate-binding domain-containing protein [Amycolatopsis rubida]